MECSECKNANICLDHREEETLVGCTNGIPDRKVQTNADKIRNMSDEELADYLTTIQEAYSCPCDYDGWLEELQSEAE